MLKGHKDTADYLKGKGALPYSDLTNVEKTVRQKKDQDKQETAKEEDKQDQRGKSPEEKKNLKEKGDDETDAKAKENAAKAAAAAALAAKEIAEKEKAKIDEKTDKQRKSPDQKEKEKKDASVGIETATVGVVTDPSTTAGKKEQVKKQGSTDSSSVKQNGIRGSPTSLKTERSTKSQTTPIYLKNKHTSTMGAKVGKDKKVQKADEVNREEVQSPSSKGKKGKHATFDKSTDNEDSGNETDTGRSKRTKHKRIPHSNSNFVESIHESVRQYQNKRNQSRQLHQLKRAQIHTGPMHDIVMFSKMMDSYRKGHNGEEDDLDIRPYASWDGYLQGEKSFVVFH